MIWGEGEIFTPHWALSTGYRAPICPNRLGGGDRYRGNQLNVDVQKISQDSQRSIYWVYLAIDRFLDFKRALLNQ